MKKDRLKDREDKYWKGASSIEDEQYLKSNNSTYFNGLKSAKKEEMIWSFDEFAAQIVVSDDEAKPIRKRVPLESVLKYSGIAAVLLLVGFLFLKNNKKSLDDNSEQHVVTPFSSAKIKESDDDTRITPKIVEERQERMIIARSKDTPEEIPSKDRERFSLSQNGQEKEAYVLINGNPIYDEEEAEEIVLTSLRLVANNLREGKAAVEKIKYMKVEL